MAMEHGVGTPARANAAWKPYRARLASNASVVRRWDDGEVAAVVEKRCEASLGDGKATVTGLALRRLLWTSATAKEEAGKCKWERRASRADAGEG